jgi:hypothetical protein
MKKEEEKQMKKKKINIIMMQREGGGRWRNLDKTQIKKIKTKLRGFSPQANYTDRATAACWRI